MRDLPELLVIVGLVVLGVGFWLGLGLPGVIGYLGGLMLAAGLVLAWWQARRPAGGAG